MSTPPSYRFGDLLALARRAWVREMAARLEDAGYSEYRRSDAAALRLLARGGPVAIGELGSLLGVTRQAARKLADSLLQRGYASVERDAADARRLNVTLTRRGSAYARAIVDVIEALNRELAQRVDPAQLRAADAVLRASISDEVARANAARLVAPPPGRASADTRRVTRT